MVPLSTSNSNMKKTEIAAFSCDHMLLSSFNSLEMVSSNNYLLPEIEYLRMYGPTFEI